MSGWENEEAIAMAEREHRESVVSGYTYRGVTSEIIARYGFGTSYALRVSHKDEDGVTITATKYWLSTYGDAEALVAKYRARWEQVPEGERTAARNAAILHDANHDCREGQR